jgi:hypothetical protein
MKSDSHTFSDSVGLKSRPKTRHFSTGFVQLDRFWLKNASVADTSSQVEAPDLHRVRDEGAQQ